MMKWLTGVAGLAALLVLARGELQGTNSKHHINKLHAKGETPLPAPKDAADQPVSFTLHSIGDSHSRWINFLPRSVLSTPEYEVRAVQHGIGARLMHSAGRDGLALLNIANPGYGIADNDIVSISFGEIDCRVFLVNYASVGGIMRELRRLVASFEKTVLENHALRPSVKIIIQGIVPPIIEGVNRNAAQPVTGRLSERLPVHVLLSYLLRDMADRHGFLFLDQFRDYSDDTGALVWSMSDQDVHIAVSAEGTVAFTRKILLQHARELQNKRAAAKAATKTVVVQVTVPVATARVTQTVWF